MEVEGYLTVKEAAEILGVTGGRIRQFIAEERLNSIKVGTLRLIKKEDLDKLEVRKNGRPQVKNPTRSALSKRKSRKEIIEK